MNVRRGLLRAWVLFAVIWAATFGALGFKKAESYRTPLPGTIVPASDLPPGLSGPWEKYQSGYWDRYGIYWLTGAGVPATVLILGFGLFWVAAGFRPKSQV